MDFFVFIMLMFFFYNQIKFRFLEIKVAGPNFEALIPSICKKNCQQFSQLKLKSTSLVLPEQTPCIKNLVKLLLVLFEKVSLFLTKENAVANNFSAVEELNQ